MKNYADKCHGTSKHGDYIADDRLATPEHFEHLKGMTDEEFAQHIEKLKKQEGLSLLPIGDIQSQDNG